MFWCLWICIFSKKYLSIQCAFGWISVRRTTEGPKVCSWWTSQQQEAAKWLAGSPTWLIQSSAPELGSQWLQRRIEPGKSTVKTIETKKTWWAVQSEKPLAQWCNARKSLWNWGHESPMWNVSQYIISSSLFVNLFTGTFTSQKDCITHPPKDLWSIHLSCQP